MTKAAYPSTWANHEHGLISEIHGYAILESSDSSFHSARRTFILGPKIARLLPDGQGYPVTQLFNLTRDQKMNWDQIEGKWKQLKGQAQQMWGDLTSDDLDRVVGKRDELIGVIQEKYGIAREEAERQVQEFESSCK